MCIRDRYNNTYESEIEIDRIECETIDSDCDCPYHYDCQHIAAVLFYLEMHLDEMLVTFSQEKGVHEWTEDTDKTEEILEVIKEAHTKEEQRKGEQYQKELLQEYAVSAEFLATSPFFLTSEKLNIDQAEFIIVFSMPALESTYIEMQFALRLPSRSKPLYVSNAKDFLEGIRYNEPINLAGKKYLFTQDSFSEAEREIVQMVIDHARIPEKIISERNQKIAIIDVKSFGMLLAVSWKNSVEKLSKQRSFQEERQWPLLSLYSGGIESPLYFCSNFAKFQITLEYIQPPTSKILLNPMVSIIEETVPLEKVYFFTCAKPGLIYNQIYYRFTEEITRQHLTQIHNLREICLLYTSPSPRD